MANLTSNECPHTKVYVTDSTMRRNQVPCPWCKDAEIKRLQESLQANITVSKARDTEVQRLRSALTKLDNGYKYPTEVCQIAREALSGGSHE